METNSPYHPIDKYNHYSSPEVGKFDSMHIVDNGVLIHKSEAKLLRRNDSFMTAMDEGLIDRELPLPTHELSVPGIEQYLALNGIVNSRMKGPYEWSDTYDSHQKAPTEQARDELKTRERKVKESLLEGRSLDSGVPDKHPFLRNKYSKKTAEKVGQEAGRLAGELDASLIMDSVLSSVSRLPLENEGGVSVFHGQVEGIETGHSIGSAPPNETASRGVIDVKQKGNLIAISFNAEEVQSWFKFTGKMGVFRKISGDPQLVKSQILVDTDKQTVLVPSLRWSMVGKAAGVKWDGISSLLSALEKVVAQEEELPSALVRK